MVRRDKSVFDPVYGSLDLEPDVWELAKRPIVQRLRAVRLSNIDSLNMPGIAGVSRFEHVLGVAHLASKTGLYQSLSSKEKVVLQSAALLHDTAMPPFGHLFEEALAYLSSPLDHEEKWSQLFEVGTEPGGLEKQIYRGRQTGLITWAEKVFGSEANNYLERMLLAIKGQGEYGALIQCDIDLDNLDNVTRVGYHMGLSIDRSLPADVAKNMTRLTDNRLVFNENALPLLERWLDLRRRVYERLMLARDDFAGKAMMIAAIVAACDDGVVSRDDWNLVDFELFEQLLQGENSRRIAEAWLIGDLWPVSELYWVIGEVPDYARMSKFSAHLSDRLSKRCLAYRIRDKRDRRLSIVLDSGESAELGKTPTRWLLGVVSGDKQAFTAANNASLLRSAEEFFQSKIVNTVQTQGESLPLFGQL